MLFIEVKINCGEGKKYRFNESAMVLKINNQNLWTSIKISIITATEGIWHQKNSIIKIQWKKKLWKDLLRRNWEEIDLN